MITIRLAILVTCSLILSVRAHAAHWNRGVMSEPVFPAQAAASPAGPQPAETEQPARKPDIILVPTPQDVVEEMLKPADVKKDEVVYDLGCGDGRIMITAAVKYGACSIPTDIDLARITEARAAAEKASVLDRVKFQ